MFSFILEREGGRKGSMERETSISCLRYVPWPMHSLAMCLDQESIQQPLSAWYDVPSSQDWFKLGRDYPGCDMKNRLEGNWTGKGSKGIGSVCRNLAEDQETWTIPLELGGSTGISQVLRKSTQGWLIGRTDGEKGDSKVSFRTSGWVVVLYNEVRSYGGRVTTRYKERDFAKKINWKSTINHLNVQHPWGHIPRTSVPENPDSTKLCIHTCKSSTNLFFPLHNFSYRKYILRTDLSNLRIGFFPYAYYVENFHFFT